MQVLYLLPYYIPDVSNRTLLVEALSRGKINKLSILSETMHIQTKIYITIELIVGHLIHI